MRLAAAIAVPTPRIPVRELERRRPPSLLPRARAGRELEQQLVQTATQDSERRFQMLVQGVTDYAIYMLDPRGNITNWNAGAMRIKGYAADEIVGQHFSRFYTPEDRADGSAGARSAHCDQRRQIRGRGLARPQGRQPLLGERGH